MTRILSCSCVALLIWVSSTQAGADECLHDLGISIGKFRGIGYAHIQSYRVEITLPDETDEEAVPLEEIWRAPKDLVLRASREGTHRAIVRSLALYLEPLYVARTSLLDADLESFDERIRAASGDGIACTAHADGSGFSIEVPIVDPDPDLPQLFQEMIGFRAELDGDGRLVRLEVELDGGAGPSQTVRLEAGYERPDHPQPDRARWTLPNGDTVEITTTFRSESDMFLPDTRHITFPSRYDPGGTEEIFVRYGPYEIDAVVPDTLFADVAAFRYDENGLVTD